MNIPEEQMDAIFTQLVALIETKSSPQKTVAQLKDILEKSHIFNFDEGQGVLTWCIQRLEQLAESYEEIQEDEGKAAKHKEDNTHNHNLHKEEQLKSLSKDILIYSSYIITFLQDLEEEGEIEIS